MAGGGESCRVTMFELSLLLQDKDQEYDNMHWLQALCYPSNSHSPRDVIPGDHCLTLCVDVINFFWGGGL